MTGRARLILLGLASICSVLASCVYEGDEPLPTDQDVTLTLLHTADWHSRLFPYDFTVGQVDENLGLVQGNSPFGGAARMSYLLQRERGRSQRVLHLDSGDVFQGAPIFNYFLGEAEMRALAASGLDAGVIGNHEFDAGGENFARQAERWATFPLLAANYLFEPPANDEYASPPRLSRISKPYTILNADGLRVGVIGIANLSSMGSIFDQPNRLGIIPLETAEVTQFYIDFLRPQVDVIVALTHLGLTADEYLIQHTSGIDVVLGGHLHIVLNPPKQVRDCVSEDENGRHYIEMYDGTSPGKPPTRRYCRQRTVVLAHSGAFMKFLGRLDSVFSRNPERIQPNGPGIDPAYDPELDGYEVVAQEYVLFPLDATVPEDPYVAEMLEPYAQSIANLSDLDQLVGYAPSIVRRFGSSGGDSPLGNLIADSMWLRLGIQTDFSLTNTTGIRTDLVPGPVSLEQMFNVFPFDNTVAKMFISGREVQELFDFVARRSASRGCNSQSQIAGARVEIDCGGTGCPAGETACATKIAIGRSNRGCATDVDCLEGELCDRDETTSPDSWRCLLAVTPDASYEMATNNYIAQGGSGFRVLQRNTTQIDTLLPQRDVLTDYIREGRPCGADPMTGKLPSCTRDSDCGEAYECVCPARAAEFDEAASQCVDRSASSCDAGNGQCVLSVCISDVVDFHVRDVCSGAIDPVAEARCQCDAAANAGAECAILACIDDSMGAVSDGRLRMRAF